MLISTAPLKHITIVFQTIFGSRIEGVTVKFKLSDQSNLSVKGIKIKGSGAFAVTWCIKWFENAQTKCSKYHIWGRYRAS